MIETFASVYHCLEDAESKDIYLNRISYLISKDFRYIRNIVEKYVPELRRSRVELYQDIENRSPGKEVIVWGCGNNSGMYLEELKKIRRLTGFCDRDPRLKEAGFGGFPVISPETLYGRYADAAVVIGTTNYYKEIFQELTGHGYPPEDIFFLGNYVDMCSYKQYFEEDFIRFEDEEIFVDCGAYDLFDSRHLRALCGTRLKKSYALEPDEQNYRNCMETIQRQGLSYIELLPYAAWSKRELLSFQTDGQAGSGISDMGKSEVQADAIDEMIPPSQKVTFIKMDIEGAELEALHGAENTIKNWRPKLAVCVYHKPEDLYEIPLYLKEIVPEYKFYLRHYSNTTCETVLYAVI